MTMDGLPPTSVLKGFHFKSNKSRSWCKKKMVTMEAMPYRSGMEMSAIGMHASSAMSRVMTNSKGCISPICRFPISRITASRAIKMIAVRRKMSPMPAVCRAGAKVCGKMRRAAVLRKICAQGAICLSNDEKGSIM